MWQTMVLAFLAGVLGVNAFPHFAKGMMGEEFPNVLGNAPVRNALAGASGLIMAVALGYWADLPAHWWPGFAALCVGGLIMTVFHGMRGAFRWNESLGKPNPVAAGVR